MVAMETGPEEVRNSILRAIYRRRFDACVLKFCVGPRLGMMKTRMGQVDFFFFTVLGRLSMVDDFCQQVVHIFIYDFFYPWVKVKKKSKSGDHNQNQNKNPTQTSSQTGQLVYRLQTPTSRLRGSAHGWTLEPRGDSLRIGGAQELPTLTSE